MLLYFLAFVLLNSSCTSPGEYKARSSLEYAKKSSKEALEAKSSLEAANEKDRVEFEAICMQAPNEEVAYTLKAIQQEYKLTNCEDTFVFLSTTANISLVNSARANLEVEKIGDEVFRNVNIIDISILKFAKNVINLNFYQNSISDLSPLKDLKYLQGIALRGNDIRDLTPLREMSNLSFLDLQGNPNLKSIEPLLNLVNLKNLNIASTEVTDLSSLSALINLEKLSYSGTPNDISPIVNLPKLTYLDLGTVKPEFLGELGKMSKLEFLDLMSMSEDWSFLGNLTNLKELKIYAISNPDFSSVSRLIKLKRLSIGSTRVSLNGTRGDPVKIQASYNTFSSLKNLSSLTIYETSLTSLPFLASMPLLTDLHLFSYGVTDKPLIGGLSELTTLEIRTRDNSGDLSFISNLKKLEKLDVQGGIGVTFSTLGSMQSLKHLRLAHFVSPIDMVQVSRLVNLQSLRLDYNPPVTDISALRSLTQLRALDLTSTPGSITFAGMSNFSKLKVLNMYGGPTFPGEGVENLIDIEIVNIGYHPPETCQAFSKLPKIRQFLIPDSNLINLNCVTNMKNLISLDIGGNLGISNTEPLKSLPLLEDIKMSGTAIADLGFLKELRFIKQINVSDTNVNDLRPLENSSRLTKIEFDLTLEAASAPNDSNCPKKAKSSVLREICNTSI